MRYQVLSLVLGVGLLACAVGHREATVPVPQPRPILVYFDEKLKVRTLLVQIVPPAWYDTVRTNIERCSGYIVKNNLSFYVAQRETLGWDLAFHVDSTIVFGLGQEVKPGTVGHEMLHHALDPIIGGRRPGETDDQYQARAHPDAYFRTRCKDYVD